jgi:hypothetical protein
MHRAVDHLRGDKVAGAHARGGQPAGNSTGPFVQLAIGEALLGAVDRQFFRLRLRVGGNDGTEIQA